MKLVIPAILLIMCGCSKPSPWVSSSVLNPDGSVEADLLYQDDGGGAVGGINRLVAIVPKGTKPRSSDTVFEASGAFDTHGPDPLSVSWTQVDRLTISIRTGSILSRKGEIIVNNKKIYIDIKNN